MVRIDRKKLRTVCLVLFVIYIVCIVYFLIFSDMFGRGSGYEEHRCNLQPFREIERFIVYRDQMTRTSVMLNLFGNVLAFIPFGMLLRWARNKNTTLLHAFVYSLFFTVAIEISQYVTKLGVLDIDDIILNTLGGVIGYAIYYISAKASRRYYAKKQRI